jgi:hypothetical protein
MPQRTREHIVADRATLIVRTALPPEWVTREQSHDYGIDLEVEYRTGSGLLAGEIVKFQVKGHEEIRFTNDLHRERIKTHTAQYWLRLRMPIFLAVVDVAAETVYCVDAAAELRKQASKAFEKRGITIPISRNRLFNAAVSREWLRSKALFDYDWRTTAQFFEFALDRLTELSRLVAWLDRCDRWMLLSVEDARQLREFRKLAIRLACAIGVDTSGLRSWKSWVSAAIQKGYPADEELPYEFASGAGWETLTLFLRALVKYQRVVTNEERSFWIGAAFEVFERWFDAELPNPDSLSEVQQFAFERETW